MITRIKFLLLATLFFPSISNLFAQCPTVDFIVSNPPFCIDEQLEIIDNTLDGVSYEWDFCSGEVEGTLTGEIFQEDIQFKSSFNVDIVKDNNLYYGFTISRGSKNMYRFDFGNSLYNNPSVVNLGNLDFITNQKTSIKLLKEGDNWYGIVSEYNPGDLVILDFGTTIESVPIVTKVFSDLGLNQSVDIDYTISQGNLIVFITNYSSLILNRLNFGNTILNTPIVTNINITGANKIAGFSLVQNCNNWYGIISSSGNNKLFKIEFGSSLLNSTPLITDITLDVGIALDTPMGSEIVSENANFYCFIQSGLGGSLYRLDFGTNMSGSVNGYDLGNLEVLGANWGFSIYGDKSSWVGFSSENTGNRISKIVFKNNCNSILPSSTEYNPITSYSQNGTYNITLKATSLNEGISYLTKPLTISPSIAPQLTTQITGNCLSNPINFDGQQLSGDIASWTWDFGDGVGSSTLQNDTYTYAAAGEYQVKLSVTDVNGCNNLYIDTARVYEEPIPSFTIPAGNLCMNNPVIFTNTSIGETGPVVSWTWDFNGEGTSADKEPIFTFLTPGSKTITLTSSIPGCANVTQQSITIEEAPTTTFSFNNACHGQTTTFTDLSTGNNLTSWNWDFGDGTNSILQNPTHEYLVPGKYVVTLAVSNNLSCTTTKVDTVYNHAIPVVDFTNDLPCSSSPIQFTDQSIVQDANIVAWEWDFGDGTTASERNPQHLYGRTGDFMVKHKAYSQYGCVDSLSTSISVIQGPEVNFSWDKGCVGVPTTFNDLTNSFGLPITSWTWIIDNQVFSEQSPTYTFTVSGTYPIELSVTTNNLCSQTSTLSLAVDIPPATSFGYFESCTNNTVTFFDTTPTPISSREWRIEGVVEGTDSILPIGLPPNDYMVSLINVSEEGCTGTLLEEIPITGTLEASFLASTNYGATPLTVDFSNQSLGTNTYLWDFGDGSLPSNDLNPQHEFIDIGTYHVKLIAYGGENCSDTTIQTIEVVEPTHDLIIEAITPLEQGKMAITMSNNGSVTYQESNSKLIFTLDNSAEITESLDSVLYPHKSMNYVPKFSLGSTGNSKVVCVSLEYNDGQSLEILDKNCLNLNNQAIIADVYPNPATDYINLSVVLPTPGNIKITLIDRNGAVLLSDAYESSLQGLNEFPIDTTPYRSGLYIIKVETENEVKEMKVVINK